MKTLKALLLVVLWGSTSYGQDYLDVLRPFLGQNVQSVGLGITETDISTSYYNPASLTSIRHPSLKFGLQNNFPSSSTQYMTNDASFSDSLNDVKLFEPSFELVLPVHVYRGSWVLGFSLSPQSYFNEMSELHYAVNNTGLNQINKTDNGKLNTATFSSGVLFTKKISLGASISVVWGNNEFSSSFLTEVDDSYYRDTLSIQPSYKGWNGKIAWIWDADSYVTFGGWLEFPTRLEVEESYYYKSETPDAFYRINDDVSYDLVGPYHIGHMVQINGDPIKLNVGVVYHDYSNMSFESNLLNDSGESLDIDINNAIPKKLNSVYEWQFGTSINRDEFNISLAFSTMQHPRESITSNIQKYNIGLNIPLTHRFKFETSLQTQTQSDKLLIISSSPNDAYAEINYNFVNFLMGIRYEL